jgi:hypothetical protein
MKSLLALPKELIIYITSFLNYDALRTLEFVSRRFGTTILRPAQRQCIQQLLRALEDNDHIATRWKIFHAFSDMGFIDPERPTRHLAKWHGIPGVPAMDRYRYLMILLLRDKHPALCARWLEWSRSEFYKCFAPSFRIRTCRSCRTKVPHAYLSLNIRHTCTVCEHFS